MNKLGHIWYNSCHPLWKGKTSVGTDYADEINNSVSRVGRYELRPYALRRGSGLRAAARRGAIHSAPSRPLHYRVRRNVKG